MQIVQSGAVACFLLSRSVKRCMSLAAVFVAFVSAFVLLRSCPRCVRLGLHAASRLPSLLFRICTRNVLEYRPHTVMYTSLAVACKPSSNRAVVVR